MLSTRFATLITVLAAAACAPVVMKTPVSGAPAAVSRLVGDWQGDYSSVESGRRGLVSFRLRAGADTAERDIIMQSAAEADPSAPNASAVPSDAMCATQ